jgi:hypothetical protein
MLTFEKKYLHLIALWTLAIFQHCLVQQGASHLWLPCWDYLFLPRGILRYCACFLCDVRLNWISLYLLQKSTDGDYIVVHSLSEKISYKYSTDGKSSSVVFMFVLRFGFGDKPMPSKIWKFNFVTRE